MARARWSAEQMRELLREQEDSGLSLKAFAKAAGIPYTTMSWWRTRLRREGDAPRLVRVDVEEPRCTALEIVVGDVVAKY